MTKATHRWKGLFGLMVPKGKEPVMAGRRGSKEQTWRQEPGAESLYLELKSQAVRALEMAPVIKSHSGIFSSKTTPTKPPLVPPTEDQVFKYVDLWGTFSFKALQGLPT